MLMLFRDERSSIMHIDYDSARQGKTEHKRISFHQQRLWLRRRRRLEWNNLLFSKSCLSCLSCFISSGNKYHIIIHSIHFYCICIESMPFNSFIIHLDYLIFIPRVMWCDVMCFEMLFSFPFVFILLLLFLRFALVPIKMPNNQWFVHNYIRFFLIILQFLSEHCYSFVKEYKANV